MNARSEFFSRASAPGTSRRSTPGIGQQIVGLLVFLGAAFAVAAIGGLSSAANVDGWYVTADKAPWSPPNWLFGPAWTFLYTAMSVAAWLVWRTRDRRAPKAIRVYAVQLALNFLWTPVFFGLYPFLGSAALWIALGIIVALIGAIIWTILVFRPISGWATLLLTPYLAWVLFATTLNIYMAFNN